MRKDAGILVTGSGGMMGRALCSLLQKEGYSRLLLPRSADLDLRSQAAVDAYFKDNQIDYVFHLAAVVGGIQANINNPGLFLYDNLIMNTILLEAARVHKTEKLLFVASSCIYPKDNPGVLHEEDLLKGPLEPTNEGYALSKITGVKMCSYYNRQYGTDFISIMPCNLYGPYDNFNPASSHVLTSLLHRAHVAKETGAKEFVLWGSGTARREFMHSDDAAQAALFMMHHYSGEGFVNVGTGTDVTIRELADLIFEIVGCRAAIVLDKSKPDGMKRKLLDVSKAASLGWQAKIALREGIKKLYDWYLENPQWVAGTD